MSQVISSELSVALAAYSAARDTGASLTEPVRAIIAATASQRPATIGDADSGIAAGAGLWSWQKEPGWFDSLFRRRKSDEELLAEVPDIAFLFLFHRSGYLRQAAIAQVSGPIPNAFLVAALAWRRNDWVRQVRDSAQACLDRCLPVTDPEVVAQFFLETTRQRATWRRWADGARLSLEAHAARPEVAQAIVGQLCIRQHGPLPSLVRHFTQAGWIDPHLDHLAREARVPGVRAVALQALAHGYAAWTDGTEQVWIDKPMGIAKSRPRIKRRPLTIAHDPSIVIRAGLADPSAVVRRAALDAIIEHGLGDQAWAAIAQPYLQDPSAAVRAKAAFITEQALA